jgi:hypothetical protein
MCLIETKVLCIELYQTHGPNNDESVDILFKV